MFKIVLRGNRPDAVLVTGLRVRILGRNEPIAGWYTPGGSCGLIPVRSAHIDLDATPPHVTYFGTHPRHPERGSDSITLELRPGQPPEVIEVFASSERYDVSWYAEVIYQVPGDGERSMRVDQGGEPFRVTALTKESRAYTETLDADGTITLVREPSLDGQTSAC